MKLVDRKKQAKILDKKIKNNLVFTAFLLKVMKDEKLYSELDEGFQSFEQYCDSRLTFSRRQADKYYLIADRINTLFIQNENWKPASEIAQTGLEAVLKRDNSSKLRKTVEFFEEIGPEKSYYLCNSSEVEFDIDANSVTLPGKQVLSVQELVQTPKNAVKKLLSTTTPKQEKPPVIPNPVKDFQDRTKRFSSQFSDLLVRYFKEPITESTFDICAEELQKLHQELKDASRAVLSFDNYCIAEADDPNLNLKDADFCATDEIAVILNVTDRAVRKWIDENKISHHFLKSHKKGERLVWRIHPEGLPVKYKSLYYAELNRRAAEDTAAEAALRQKERQLILNRLTKKQRRKTENILFCIDNYGHLKGTELELALEKHNAEHPEDKPIALKSFYRYMKDYQEKGIRGVADMRGINRYGETKVNDDDFKYFRDAFLTENKKSHTQCWEETLGKAKREGRITIEDGKPHEIDTETGEILGTFPSESTFRRLLDRRVPEATQIEMREGKHRFKQTIHFKHINVTRETINPGQIYVMDHHTFDVLCKPTDKKVVTDLLNKILYHNLSHSDKLATEDQLKRILKSGLSAKKHVRFWLTNCMDYRTNKQLAWYLHEDAPNTDHVMLTFKWAVEKHGYPEVLMLDNGKDFLANDFAGNPHRREDIYDEVKIHNLLSYLPTEAHFVGVRESQAKPIERQYQQIINQYARQWPTYTGKNPAARPELTSELLGKGKLPTALEVIEQFDDFVINTLNRKKQSGKALNGKSPDQVWNELHPGPKMPTQAALELMTMRNSKPRQIYGNGFKMPLMGEHFYWAEWMQGLSSTKEKYYAKWDPYKWDQIFIFRLRDHKPMGWAYLEKMTSAYATTAAERQELTDAIQKKKAAAKRRKVTAREVRKIAAGESLQNLAAYVEHENEVYEAVHGLREDGVRPIKLVQTGLDDLARSMENSFQKNFNEKAHMDLDDVTPSAPKKDEYKDDIVDYDDMD